ncbi:putative reverse transcriptase [Trifolium medium]|uniref:Putative reverse transcriptase n=1 Tax=Trifolium medium TaxID=97028 RepID=A0A392LWP3_9FABA|nr:putative reverse transcriptase [Trifolium medium]
MCMSLNERRVRCPSVCLLCSEADEDDWHILFECKLIKDCWNVVGLDGMLQQRLRWCSSAKELLMDICRNEGCCIAGRIAMLVWTAVNLLRKRCSHSHSTRRSEHNLRWEKPGQGLLKCSVDAGFHVMEGVTKGEAAALLEATDMARNRNSEHAIFEKDSQMVVEANHSRIVET